MSKIVYVWEWGAGRGHLARFAPLARDLVSRGHTLFPVVKDLKHVATILGELAGDTIPIDPFARSPEPIPYRSPRSFWEVACNLQMHDPSGVNVAVGFWRDVFHRLDPDLVLTDFGYVASAVARSMGIPVFRLGSGFECPPERPDACFDDANGASDAHQRVVRLVNSALSHHGLSPVLDGQPDVTSQHVLLSTVRELDPYRRAGVDDASYLGTWDRLAGEPVRWSSRSHPRAFAYVRPFANIDRWLNQLVAAGFQIALTQQGFPDQLKRNLSHPRIHVHDSLIDLDAAAPDVSIAITNGNLGTTLRFLSLGVPVLVCPLYLEQKLTGDRVDKLRLGACIDPQDPESLHRFADVVSQLQSDEVKRRVQQFAERNRNRFLEGRGRAVSRICKFLSAI